MKIFDAHNDFLTELRNKKARATFIKRLNQGNVTILSAVWTSELKNPQKVLCSTKKEIENNKHCILSIEDLGFITENNLDEALDCIICLKPFSCGIVWNEDNSLGGGAFGKSGLTTLGEVVVGRLENAGIIVDTAHMNRKTFWDFAKITSKPLFNSHTNLYEMHKHKRNLTEKQINKIISSKGMICLSFVNEFISSRKVGIQEVAQQIKYFINKYGDKNIGIGSDFFGTENLPRGLNKYLDFNNLKTELKRIGVKQESVNRVLYKNMSHFCNKFVRK